MGGFFIFGGYMKYTAAAIQFTPEKGQVVLNRERISELCDLLFAKKEDVRLIVLPEMCATGYIFTDSKDVFPLCEEAEGETFKFFSGICAKHKCFMAYGFPEKSGENLYNSQNLISPEGSLLATYRKVNLYEADTFWAKEGDSYLHVDTEIGRLGMGICMDLNFDGFTQYHISNGTDIILFSTNWLFEGVLIHPYWQMRLKGFSRRLIAANRCGGEDGVEFCGWSAVIENGEITGALPKNGDGFILHEVTL